MTDTSYLSGTEVNQDNGGSVGDNMDTYNTISAICWCVATPLAVLASGFSVLVVHRSPVKDDVTQTFVASISTLVLVLTLCLGPTAALTSIAGGQWILGDAFCTAQSLLLAGLPSALSVLMFVFSIERYLFMAYPLRYPLIVTITRTRFTVACTVPVVLVVVLFCGFLSDWRGSYMTSWHACVPHLKGTVVTTLYLSTYLVMKLIPAVIGYAIHCSLLLLARRHLRRILAIIPSGQPEPTTVLVSRRLQLNTTRGLLLTAFALIFLAMDLIPDLACFFPIPNYIVLPGNLAFVLTSCVLPMAHIYSIRTLKRSAKRTIAACCWWRSNRTIVLHDVVV